MTYMKLGTCVVATVLACIAVPGAVQTAQAQRSGVEIWSATCGRCHLLQPPGRYTPKDWDAIGTHMVITARLTDRQAEAVMDFLKSSALTYDDDADATAVKTATPSRAQRPVQVRFTSREATHGPAQIPKATEHYQRLCAPCHGKTGRGDGPAATALTPRPASFVDVSFQASRSDEELIEAITNGRQAMPSFGKQLSAGEIKELVGYIRTLGKPPK